MKGWEIYVLLLGESGKFWKSMYIMVWIILPPKVHVLKVCFPGVSYWEEVRFLGGGA